MSLFFKLQRPGDTYVIIVHYLECGRECTIR